MQEFVMLNLIDFYTCTFILLLLRVKAVLLVYIALSVILSARSFVSSFI